MKHRIKVCSFFLLIPLLMAGCGDSHDHDRDRDYSHDDDDDYWGYDNYPPISVRNAFSTASFRNGERTLVMQLEIRNDHSRELNIDKIECIFETTRFRPASDPRIVADFEMEFNGRSYTFPTPLEVDGPSFGLFFYGEYLAPGEILVAKVYATITGCGRGESVIFAEQAIGVRGYDDETGYSQVWLTCE